MKSLSAPILFFMVLCGNVFATTDFTAIDVAINAGQFAEARAKLQTAVASAPSDFEALWRLARLEVFEADALTGDAAKEAGYEKSLKTAELAIKANPQHAAGYLRKASAAGKIALFKGVLQARELVNTVKESSEKAIALGNGGDDTQAWAHYVLGRAHLKLSATPAVIRRPIGLGWGSVAKAEEHLTKAVGLKKNSALIWLEVARLRKAQKNQSSFDEAMRQVNTLAALEPTDRQAKAEAKELQF